MARNLLRLKRRAYKAGVRVIYVNDNFAFFLLQTTPTCVTSICLCPRIARFSNIKRENDSALHPIKKFLKADTRRASRIMLRRPVRRDPGHR
jgi:hypothetical protein